MTASGVTNLITAVPGIRVGNAAHDNGLTGVTVVVAERPAVAAVAVYGGGPGTRETDALQPQRLVPGVDAVVLSGGSAFGLAAADGAMQALARMGRGFAVAGQQVPIVPAAILFDLPVGGDWDRQSEAPYRRLGEQAVAAADSTFALGNAGAGCGARCGRFKGGLGSAAGEDDFQVGALAAVNAVGSPVIPGTPLLWAWPWERHGELGDQRRWLSRLTAHEPSADPLADTRHARGHTTLGVIATDAPLDKGQALQVAVMAQAGLARALVPVYTPFDGDCVFVLATGSGSSDTTTVARIGSLAADCLTRAVARGVYEAVSIAGLVAYRDVFAAEFSCYPTI